MRTSLLPLRPWAGLLVGIVGVAVVVVLVAPFEDSLSRVVPALLLVVPVVAAALVGGLWPALGTAVLATLGFALYLPPLGSPRVRVGEDVVAIVVFVLVAAVLGVLVSAAAEAEQRHQRAEHERLLALEAVDHQRSVMLRSVSHDLRTPLSTIRAVATDLQSGASYDDDTRRELLGLVVDESDRLDRIVANLLGLARIDAGALPARREPVVLDQVVQASLHRLARLTRSVHLEARLAAGPAVVLADATQLDQVVANLVDNAVRHAAPGSVVHVSTHAGAHQVELDVEDDGQGVAERDRERIFEPFTTVDGTSTGLGLAICKALVEAHGGTIAVTAAPTGGARFSVRLPRHG